MKTAKMIVSIISIVLFGLIAFQSCAAGISNAMSENGEISGTSGMVVAFCMLIAGIVGLATRRSRGGGLVATGFYFFGGLVGIVSYGSFADLAIWSVVSFIFGVIYFLGSRSKYFENKGKEV